MRHSSSPATLIRVRSTRPIGRDPEIGTAAFARLQSDVAIARRDGFASNHQDTERGVTALGVALAPLDGRVDAAICIAMPTVRFRRPMVATYALALREAADAIEQAGGLPG
jgi:IclR family transcriptional regulator, acetate operon repressor